MDTGLSSADEIADKGLAIYNSRLRSTLESEHMGEFAAIDINSGEYGLGLTIVDALDAVTARIPNASCYVVKIGYTSAVALGSRLVKAGREKAG
ncbi:MAG TPA: hypothetical protein VGK19_09080 [Capsulimonadaceae bacterium]|jgi:hypothetical protein